MRYIAAINLYTQYLPGGCEFAYKEGCGYGYGVRAFTRELDGPECFGGEQSVVSDDNSLLTGGDISISMD